MINYQEHLDYVLNNIKKNSISDSNQDKINLVIEIIKKYISTLIYFGYIDYVNFNNIITYLNSITITLDKEEVDDSYTVYIDFNIKEQNIIISICQAIGELLLNDFHKDNIHKFALTTSNSGKVKAKEIEDGFYCINKALSYELAYQVYEFQTKEKRVSKVIENTLLFKHPIKVNWYKDYDIEETVNLFCGILYRTNKEEGLPYLAKKSFDKFLFPQISNTRVENIDIYLSAIGCVKRVLDGEKELIERTHLGIRILEEAYQKIK